MASEEYLTVGAVAALTGLTVRALHHYDAIGLVTPHRRSSTGYRLYGHGDIQRLQEVLYFRELGVGLKDIMQIVDSPGYQRQEALRQHRQLLEAKVGRLRLLIGTIDKAIESEETGMALSAQEMLEIFGDHDPTAFRTEAAERWGETDAFARSASRIRGYTRQDWRRLQGEAEAISAGLIDLAAAGIAPDDPAVASLVDQHRKHITTWFYPCDAETHAGLGRVYLNDERFREQIDSAGEGLADYLAAAIAARYGSAESCDGGTGPAGDPE